MRKLTLMLAATAVAGPALSQPQYASCLERNTQFYGMYCHNTDDVLRAVRGACREHLSGMFGELTPSDQSAMITKYLSVMDETATKILLDFRIQKKIDCGQFNDAAPRDLIDELNKP